MSFLIFLIIFIVLVIPIGIFLRMLDLGLKVRKAIILTIIFPFDITRLHVHLFNSMKNEDKKRAIKVLIAPITDLPEVIISYTEMHISMEAKLLAIKELLNELEEKDIRKLAKQLKKQGFIIKRKKIKQVDEFTDNQDSLNKYLDNLGFPKIADVY
ncbi:hypothetical protein WAX74_15325 [Psychrobacillus sp. FJAT-51614]|uniref:Uncharacterized protein n=1 Tax=Psychrobacillus mangrovi TaxID=3117745 RepID=A0ABU8F7L9_9BACI